MKNLYSLLLLLFGCLFIQAQTYCTYTTSTVEPVTYINVKDQDQSVTLLDNHSPGNSTEAQELFLDQVLHVYAGERYWVRLAAGDMTTYYTISVDWNQNGTLDDDGEVTQIGVTSAPNQQALGALDIPEGLLPGQMRMRVIGNVGGFATDMCNGSQAGQAEDYTLSIDSFGDNDPYCNYSVENILPITKVESAGINNQTSATSNSEQEYFLEYQAQYVKGQSYDLTLEGNTGGNFTDYYTLFIDWNKNEVLDDESEVYELGTISNSDGTDGTQLVYSFDITDALPLGPTRIRIIKNRGAYATDPCGDYEFGQAEDYSITVRNPAPENDNYCGPINYSYGTEPITYVNFAGIDNRSSASTSSPDHEYFLELEATVDKNQEYEVVLEGNTNGNWTSSFSVFIDWNHNNSFEDLGERYEIGTVTHSSGEDGQQATASISVPMSALSGTTRMRVMKMYSGNSYPQESCSADNFGGDDASGQAEDYSVYVNLGCEQPSLTIDVNSVEACEGTGAILEAQTTGGQVFWFDSQDAETPIGSGLTFETPELTESTSFWAEASSGEFFEGARIEPEYFDAVQVNEATSPWGLAFNLTEPIQLNSVDVYIADEEGGEIIVKLYDEDWTEYYSTTVILPAGNPNHPVKYELPLGFFIPEGNNYRLVAESSPMLVRELANQHSGFPYGLSDLGEITSGTINNGGANSSYYFFYNWKFNTGDSECKSERIEVAVTVNPAPDMPTGDEIQYFALGETLADLEISGENLTWYSDEFGETEIPQNTELVDGTTYYVSQSNGTCESELFAVTVYLVLGVSDIGNTVFTYYPNPVKNVLNISSKKEIENVSVFTLTGQKVLNHAKGSNSQVDVSALAPGTYVFKLTFEGGQIEAFKIIKQ